MDTSIYKTHFSLTVSGTGNNNFCPVKAGEETDFLSWYRIRRFGALKIAVKFFNEIYSTGCGVRGQKGATFTIVSAAVGFGKKPGKQPEAEAALTFGGETGVSVIDGFESDDTEIFIPEGCWLSVRLRVRTETDAQLLSTDESASGGYRNGLRTLNVLRPNFIGCRGEFGETLAFFGDSITQGTRTAADRYEAWSHRVGLAMPPEVNVINLGMGWSRAYDAAADGLFMRLACLADRITICFGVNDIKSGGKSGAEIIESLRRIIHILKERTPGVDIILFTVPPFNLTPHEEEQRLIVNREILSGALNEKVFDFAKVLEGEPGRVRPEFMADSEDAHPNGRAGEAAAQALLKSGLLSR